jgi:hypothetical protein
VPSSLSTSSAASERNALRSSTGAPIACSVRSRRACSNPANEPSRDPLASIRSVSSTAGSSATGVRSCTGVSRTSSARSLPRPRSGSSDSTRVADTSSSTSSDSPRSGDRSATRVRDTSSRRSAPSPASGARSVTRERGTSSTSSWSMARSGPRSLNACSAELCGLVSFSRSSRSPGYARSASGSSIASEAQSMRSPRRRELRWVAGMG